MKLEIISRYPAGEPHPVQLLFVHGAFMGAWVWDKHILPFFAQHGFAAHAVSLRGHGHSEGRGRLHGSGLDDFVSDVDTAVAEIGVLPALWDTPWVAPLCNEICAGGVYRVSYSWPAYHWKGCSARASTWQYAAPVFGLAPTSCGGLGPM